MPEELFILEEVGRYNFLGLDTSLSFTVCTGFGSSVLRSSNSWYNHVSPWQPSEAEIYFVLVDCATVFFLDQLLILHRHVSASKLSVVSPPHFTST